MSMKFAGFMGAVREDRVAREEREAAEKTAEKDRTFRREMLEAEFDRRAEIESLGIWNKQREKDTALNTATQTFISSYNLPESAAALVRQEIQLRGGLAAAVTAYEDGRFSVELPTAGSGGTENSKWSTGSAVLSGDAETVRTEFMSSVYEGGLTNPYGLAAVMATAKHESAFDPKNVNRVWRDDSETGRKLHAGGVMSWNGPRLEAMQAFTGGDASPAAQGRFFVNEDPELIQKLNAATSAEEADTLMRNAWRFAGYDRPGNEEAAARLATTKSLVPEIETMAMFQAVEKTPETKADQMFPIGTEVGTQASATTQTQAPTSEEVAPSTGRIIRKTTAQLKQEQDARDRIVDGQDSFVSAVTKADTKEKLLALQGTLNALVDVPQVEIDRRKGVISGQIEVMQEREREVALQEQEPMYFYPLASDNTLTSEAVQIRKTKDGTWVDTMGNQIDVTKGRYFADDGLDSWKVANTQLKELNTLTTGAVGAAMAVINYRNAVVEGGDAGVNRWLNALSSAESEVTQLEVALREASQESASRNDGGAYFRSRESEFRERLKSIATSSSVREMMLLNAAYAMASMRGSSGQALSDKELIQNLKALGQGKGNVDTILTMIDKTFNDILLTGVDVRRTSMLDGIGLTPSGKAFVSSTNLDNSFKSILDDAIKESGNTGIQKGYQALVNREISSEPPSDVQGQETDTETVEDFSNIPELSPDDAMLAYNNGDRVVVTQDMLDKWPKSFVGKRVGDILEIDETEAGEK